MRVRGVRGAIAVREDDREAVLDATERLLGTLLERNAIGTDDIVSVIFTATDDLRAAFPAEAARRMGLGAVPLLCARELSIDGSMPRVVRVLLHVWTGRSQDELQPVYLDGAESLRDDLVR